MKKITGIIGTATLALMLGACGGTADDTSGEGSVEDGEQTTANGAIDHGVKDKSELEDQDGESEVGFSLEGDTIEEAADVPENEKKAILDTFDKYIETLNAGEVDAYLETLSPESYNLDEERAATEEMLEVQEFERTPDDVTIVKYGDEEAQVFSTMKTVVKTKEDNHEESNEGRQVTVLVNEEDSWKVKSVHYIGDQAPAE